jgi:fructokinase
MVLFVGELLADMISQEYFEKSEHFYMKVGGSPGNIASYLAQLGIPARVISRVGNDIIGERILRKLSQNGVDVRYVQRDNYFGTTLVFVQKTIESPDFFVLRGADRFLELPDENSLDQVKILHLSCWLLTFNDLFEKTIHLLEIANQKGIKIGFDPNCRDKLFDCKKIPLERLDRISKVTYCKPSLDDAIAIFGQVDYKLEDIARYYIDKFHEKGVENVALTLGKYGAYISDGKSITHIPSSVKKVVDATGAGDGFWAGMYYGILTGRSFLESCKLGSKVAGHILGFIGADVRLSKEILEE